MGSKHLSTAYINTTFTESLTGNPDSKKKKKGGFLPVLDPSEQSF